jgi:hypothetical protein
MTKLTFFQISTAVLIVLNIGLLCAFALGKPKHPEHDGPGPKRRALEILKLDKNQLDEFIKLAKQHHEMMMKFDEQQRKLLVPYFSNKNEEESPENEDYLEQLLQIEKQKISFTKSHFEEVKSMLKPEQYPNLEQLIHEVMNENNKKSPPPKK